MSQPSIGTLEPPTGFDTQQTVNLILTAIGLEQLALGHLLNGEAEKLQRAIGTLEVREPTGAVTVLPPLATTLEELLLVNQDIRQTLREAIAKEIVMAIHMETLLDLVNAVDTDTDENGG